MKACAAIDSSELRCAIAFESILRVNTCSIVQTWATAAMETYAAIDSSELRRTVAFVSIYVGVNASATVMTWSIPFTVSWNRR